MPTGTAAPTSAAAGQPAEVGPGQLLAQRRDQQHRAAEGQPGGHVLLEADGGHPEQPGEERVEQGAAAARGQHPQRLERQPEAADHERDAEDLALGGHRVDHRVGGHRRGRDRGPAGRPVAAEEVRRAGGGHHEQDAAEGRHEPDEQRTADPVRGLDQRDDRRRPVDEVVAVQPVRLRVPVPGDQREAGLVRAHRPQQARGSGAGTRPARHRRRGSGCSPRGREDASGVVTSSREADAGEGRGRHPSIVPDELFHRGNTPAFDPQSLRVTLVATLVECGRSRERGPT